MTMRSSASFAAMLPIIVLTVILSLTRGVNSELPEVNPYDLVIHNGTDLTLNCTVPTQSDGRTASDIRWSECGNFALNSCEGMTGNYTVEVINDGLSQLHLHLLHLLQQKTYVCHFGSRPTTLELASTVVAGIPPNPVDNLQCSSFNKLNFTCTWGSGGYTGISNGRTHIQYRERSTGNWMRQTLPLDATSFTGPAKTYEMEISVVQENKLGNSTASTTTFAAATQTIPKPPKGLVIAFVHGEDDIINLQMQWNLPNGWSPTLNLLQYEVEYRAGESGRDTLVQTNADQSFTVTDILPYTDYRARVRCMLVGAIDWSEWSPFKTRRSPEAAPSGEIVELTATIQTSTSRDPFKRDVQLTWQPPAMDERNGDIRGYQLNVTELSLHTQVTSGSFVLIDLDRFKAYEVTIAAYTVEGAVGPVKKFEIKDMTKVPAQVENLQAISQAPDTIQVSWRKPSVPQGVILGYVIRWNLRGQTSNVRIKEAVHIRLHQNNINRDSGSVIPCFWLATIRHHDPVTRYIYVCTSAQYGEQRRGPTGYNRHRSIQFFSCLMKASISSSRNVAIKQQHDIKRRMELPAMTTRYRLTSLRPYTQYQVSITILNKAGFGEALVENATTQFTKPSLPINLRHLRSSPTEIQLSWGAPQSWNGPVYGYEVHYRPSGSPPRDSIVDSASGQNTRLKINCSAYEEPVTFEFLVFASTGTNRTNKLLGDPSVLKQEMCGPGFATTTIVIAVLAAAFSVVLLMLCLYKVRRSPLLKPPPDPYFVDGILEASRDKLMFNSRLATRRQEKEDYDTVKSCDSVRELIGPSSEVVSNKGSTGSSDQGFHEMPPDIGLEAIPGHAYTRCSSGYGHSLQSQSELDLHQKQRMLSNSEEFTEDVFECPEDIDTGDGGDFVNSYQTAKASPPASPGSVQLSPCGSKESVHYTSRKASPVSSRRPESASPPTHQNHRLSSGSESGSMTYLQLGANFPHPAPTQPKKATANSPIDTNLLGNESYSQMAIQREVPAPNPGELPPYESVWPPVESPESQNSSTPEPDPAWMDRLHTTLGFNNNSKEIPDIHAAGDLFRPPQEIIVATAFSPSVPPVSGGPKDAKPSLPRLSSESSEDYVEMVGGASSPRANAPQLPQNTSPACFSPPVTTTSPCCKRDISCQDYVMQSELPPTSPALESCLH